jgi:hypothetical protein
VNRGDLIQIVVAALARQRDAQAPADANVCLHVEIWLLIQTRPPM